MTLETLQRGPPCGIPFTLRFEKNYLNLGAGLATLINNITNVQALDSSLDTLNNNNTKL